MFQHKLTFSTLPNTLRIFKCANVSVRCKIYYSHSLNESAKGKCKRKVCDKYIASHTVFLHILQFCVSCKDSVVANKQWKMVVRL